MPDVQAWITGLGQGLSSDHRLSHMRIQDSFSHCYQYQNENAGEITVQVPIIVDSTENTE